MIEEARIWKFVVSPKLVGSGTSGCASRIGAHFNSEKHWLVIFAIISPDIDPVVEPESIATNRPVFFTELMMVDQSIGFYMTKLYERNFCQHSGGDINWYLKKGKSDVVFIGSSILIQEIFISIPFSFFTAAIISLSLT